MNGARTFLPVLTVSQMRTFRRCPREHHYRYDLGYKSCSENENARFGSLVHEGLEAWWLAINTDAAAALANALAAVAHCEDPFERARAEDMLVAYHARWANEPLEMLHVEAEFSAPLENPDTGAPSRTFRLGGKLDVLVRHRVTQRVFIVEHKTSGEDLSPGSDYWRRLRLDAQISTYLDGGRQYAAQIDGVIYDVLGKPGIRPLKATPVESRKYTKQRFLYANQRAEDETLDEFRIRFREHLAENPDRYLARTTVVRLEKEVRDAASDVWATAALIREARNEGRHPRNPDACSRYGSQCPFWSVCGGEASLDDETRFRRVDNVHEELATHPTAPIAARSQEVRL